MIAKPPALTKACGKLNAVAAIVGESPVTTQCNRTATDLPLTFGSLNRRGPLWRAFNAANYSAVDAEDSRLRHRAPSRSEKLLAFARDAVRHWREQ